MKKVLLSTVVTLAFAVSANAAAKSEFWFQPGAGKSTFDMGVATTPTTVKTNSAGTTAESKVTSMPLVFKFSQGITEEISWNVGSDFGTEETKTGGSTSKESGLGNINVGALASMNEWYYGADASLSLSKKKAGTSTEAGTRVTGGQSLTPFAGYHMAAMGLGARLDYAYNMDRKKQETTGDTTTKGGNSISLTPYWETNYASGMLGAKFVYSQVASESSTGATTQNSNAFTSMSLGAYVAHDITANGTIVANLDMATVPEYDFDSTTRASASGTNMSVSYRMGF
jgi:hypothetical protein